MVSDGNHIDDSEEQQQLQQEDSDEDDQQQQVQQIDDEDEEFDDVLEEDHLNLNSVTVVVPPQQQQPPPPQSFFLSSPTRFFYSAWNNVKFSIGGEKQLKIQNSAGTVNWGTATVVAFFAGLLYGGSKEASASVSKDAEVLLKLGSTPDKREQYRLMRDAMEKRFLKVARGSLVGGVRLGMFTATFFGVQDLLAEKRGVHDVFNIAGAGSATAATFGMILPGSLRWRARNVMLGSVLGAVFCFPLGWIQLKLIEKANEGHQNAYVGSSQGGVGAAIERLEDNFKKREQ